MMPAVGLIGISRTRWLPPLPVPLFLLWPLVPLCLGLARLMDRSRPVEAAKLRAAIYIFCELRGLRIDVDTADERHVRIRFI